MENTLTRRQFDILEILEKEKQPLELKLLAQRSSLSLDIVNCVVMELSALGYLDKSGITDKGIQALEPYRIKRAVFLAAGFGSRLVPITLNTPKPLVRVNGKRIIDGLIDAALAAGIEEIIIVRGYLAEQFDQLLYKYPMIKFIDNTEYNSANNISSAMRVRELLCNSYVFEADLLIHNPEIVRKYHYASNFLGIKMEHSDDWCFMASDGIITSQTVGGTDCYQEVGISYWNEEDGKKLAAHIKATFEMQGGRDAYWDQVPFVFFKDEYKVEIRECLSTDIVEIDTFSELKMIDKVYDV